MKVPIAERQVQENPTLLGSPQTIQAPKLSNAVPGAFGEDVAVATEGLGKSIQGVANTAANIVAYQNAQEAKQQEARIKTKSLTDWNDFLYSQEEIVVKDANGNDRKILKGANFRTGDDAKGLATAATEFAFKQEQELLPLARNENSKQELQNFLANTRLSYLEHVSNHEFTEVRKAREDYYKNSSLNLIDQATLAKNPKTLSGSIQEIKKNNATWASALTKGTAWLEQQNHDDIAKALWNSTDSVLETTGSVDAAKQLLNDESLKAYIPEDLYKVTEEKLGDRGDRLKQQINRKNSLYEYERTYNVAAGIGSGKINLDDPNIDVLQLAGGNTKLSIALRTIQEQRYKGKVKSQLADKNYTGINTYQIFSEGKEGADLMGFQKHLRAVLKTGSKEQLNDTMIDALNAYGNKEYSQEKLNIIINEVANQAKIVPLQDDDDMPGITPQEIDKRAGIKNIDDWSKITKTSDDNTYVQYINAVNAGMKPQEALDLAKRSTMVKIYPELAGLDVLPSAVVDSNDQVRFIYEKNSSLTPDRVYDRQSMGFKPNSKKPKNDNSKESKK